MRTIVVFLAGILLTAAACAQTRCVQTEFSGEVSQGDAFRKQIGEGIAFSVNSIAPKDMGASWFDIGVIRQGEGAFVFQQSDANWALAANNYGSVFVGGPRSDVRAALGYTSRYLLLPLSAKDLPKARQAAEHIRSANTAQQLQNALTSLNQVRLAHAQFEIKDYRLGADNPPTTVEWLKFDVKLTVPADFALASDLVGPTVECPFIPAAVLDDMRHPARYEYWLAKSTGQRAGTAR